MARKFSELKAKMSPERRERARAEAKRLLAEMPLNELRLARALTQEQMAALLEIDQASVSKIEHRTDMYISTLSNFIRAMGGHLEIKAVFPDGEVKISQFEKLAQST